MTQDEIIRSPLGREQLIALAWEAGLEPRREMGVWGGAMHELKSSELSKLKRFAALIAAHEREACAKVCEEGTALTAFQSKDCYSYARNRAAAIRARSSEH